MWNKYLIFLLLLAACKGKTVNPAEITVYAGPVATVLNVKTDYSDSARTKIVLQAPLQLEYQDGDREFPKGIKVQFFEKDGKVSSTLTSKYARYEKTYDIYIAKDSVVILDEKDKRKLNTEELRWSRPKAKVYNDKFVRIETQKEILTGVGLDAAQDFSYYSILKPAGNFATSPLDE